MAEAKQPPQVAACDSQVLMWAFPWAMRTAKKKQTTPQDVVSLRKRARWLFDKLNENGIQLYIPSIVVTELLCGVDQKKHSQLLVEFDERFFCPPYDTKACALAARLWQFERGLHGSGGLPVADRTDRSVLKSDILIIASASAAGANRFYSHEGKCRRLAAEAGMQADDLPVMGSNLFSGVDEDNPDKEGWE